MVCVLMGDDVPHFKNKVIPDQLENVLCKASQICCYPLQLIWQTNLLLGDTSGQNTLFASVTAPPPPQ